MTANLLSAVAEAGIHEGSMKRVPPEMLTSTNPKRQVALIEIWTPLALK